MTSPPSPAPYLSMAVDISSLNPAQQQAVLSRDSHLLVIAGPGSGKTRVLTHRIASLIDEGAKPHEILAVTFTNKAAAEMRERLTHLLDESAAKSVWAGTFHSVCARMLRYEHVAAGLPRDFQIIDANDSTRVITNLLLDRGVHQERKDAASDARDLKDRISFAKNTLSHTSGGLSANERAMFDAYQHRLEQMKALDFDDLLTRALLLLQGTSDVAHRWRTRFSHVLVDEFQDTNAVQLALVKLLTSHGLCTAVGDVAQSIYSWRGADHTSITRFEDAFSPSSVVQLGENYRSTPEIVAVCQAILDAEPDDGFRLTLSTSNPSGSPVRVRECDDDRSEASYVVQKIARSSRSLNSHAVLVRTAAQTRSLEEEFLSSGIPYVIVGGLRFYERAEVRDALAYLRTACFACDVVSMARAAATPRRGLGEKALADITTRALELGSVIPALETHDGRGKKGAQEFALTLSSVIEAADGSLVEAVRYVTDSVLKPTLGSDLEAESRRENLDQLVAAASTFAGMLTATGEAVSDLPGIEALAAFLEHVALVSAGDESRDDCVQVMTMHAAKGREFPHVFVVGLEEDLLPHVRARHDAHELSEERRLFYVACSRAMDELDLVWARRRFMHGSPRDQQRSRFVADVLDAGVVSHREDFRKAPWTTNHRSRPVGAAAAWARPAPTSTTDRPRRTIANPSRTAPTDLAVGERVSHPSFGAGAVVSLRDDTAVIAFSDRQRTLSLAIAPLTRL